MYSRYLLILSLLFLLCMPPLAASWLYLRNSGELHDTESVAAQQAASSEFCIVGTALHEDLYRYKLALYRAYKPEVIALGSSRMLQYRGLYFRGHYLNMGSSLREIATGEHILAAMLKTHRPKLILLGVDYWWFNDSIEKPGRTQSPKPRMLELDIGKLLQPYAWMREGKLDAARFLARLNPFLRSDHCRIGVSALEEASGFGPDGSYYYTGTVTGAKHNVYDRGFGDTLKEMHKGRSRLRHGTQVNPAHVAMFRNFVDEMNKAGIKVVLILPPHAPRIAREMRQMGNAYAYIGDMHQKLDDAGLRYHDFHDPSSLGATDCEFYDGSHAGDIVAARVLRQLAQDSDTGLAPYLDLVAIESAIVENTAMAMLPDKRVTRLPEVDFLDLGCEKRRH